MFGEWHHKSVRTPAPQSRASAAPALEALEGRRLYSMVTFVGSGAGKFIELAADKGQLQVKVARWIGQPQKVAFQCPLEKVEGTIF